MVSSDDDDEPTENKRNNNNNNNTQYSNIINDTIGWGHQIKKRMCFLGLAELSLSLSLCTSNRENEAVWRDGCVATFSMM